MSTRHGLAYPHGATAPTTPTSGQTDDLAVIDLSVLPVDLASDEAVDVDRARVERLVARYGPGRESAWWRPAAALVAAVLGVVAWWHRR